MCSGGYPLLYDTGYEITGLDEVPEGVTVYHAGTREADGKYYTSGGRVLGVTATGADLPSASKAAYEGVKKISFPTAHYRRDIGTKPL
jgi:phosphoribosylamine--glycine ligase